MKETSRSWITDSSVLRIGDPVIRTAVTHLLDNLGVHKHTKEITTPHAVARVTLASNAPTERDRVLHEVAKHMERIIEVPHKEIHMRPTGGTNVIITYQARM
jgi:hypothetical protein